MNTHRFATLFAALTAAPSRRAALRALGGLGLAGLVGQTDAKKKKRRKKKKCAKAGQATSKKRKKCCKGLVKDTAGRCARRCTPTSCAADQLCLANGVCQPCTVTCPAGATDCAAALEATLAAGGTVYVCPGLYQGDIVVGQSVTVIGAGQGDDPASNTILQGTGTRSVVRIASESVVTVALQSLRIRGGGGGPGGGVQNADPNILSLLDCTITGNAAESTSGAGGGVFTGTGSRLALTRCTVSGNTADNGGGGITSYEGRLTLTETTVSGNTTTWTGGGIDTFAGTLTLDAASRVTGNGSRPDDPDSGGGIFIEGGTTVTLASTANVSGNTPDNCGGDAVSLCVD